MNYILIFATWLLALPSICLSMRIQDIPLKTNTHTGTSNGILKQNKTDKKLSVKFAKIDETKFFIPNDISENLWAEDELGLIADSAPTKLDLTQETISYFENIIHDVTVAKENKNYVYYQLGYLFCSIQDYTKAFDAFKHAIDTCEIMNRKIELYFRMAVLQDIPNTELFKPDIQERIQLYGNILEYGKSKYATLAQKKIAQLKFQAKQ